MCRKSFYNIIYWVADRILLCSNTSSLIYFGLNYNTDCITIRNGILQLICISTVFLNNSQYLKGKSYETTLIHRSRTSHGILYTTSFHDSFLIFQVLTHSGHKRRPTSNME